MGKKLILLVLIGVTSGMSLMSSCTSEEINDVDVQIEPELSTNFFTNSNEQKVVFNIAYEVPEEYKVVFDVYAENPYNVSLDGFSKKEGVTPIISGMTDGKGQYQIARVISKGVKEVYVTSDVAGVPALLYGKIHDGYVNPVELEMTSLVEEDFSSRAVWNAMFLGSWNYWGRPNYIDGSISCPVSKKDLRAISAALPEWKTVDSKYTDALPN